MLHPGPGQMPDFCAGSGAWRPGSRKAYRGVTLWSFETTFGSISPQHSAKRTRRTGLAYGFVDCSQGLSRLGYYHCRLPRRQPWSVVREAHRRRVFLYATTLFFGTRTAVVGGMAMMLVFFGLDGALLLSLTWCLSRSPLQLGEPCTDRFQDICRALTVRKFGRSSSCSSALWLTLSLARTGTTWSNAFGDAGGCARPVARTATCGVALGVRSSVGAESASAKPGRGQVNASERDYRENIADQMKIGILIM